MLSPSYFNSFQNLMSKLCSVLDSQNITLYVYTMSYIMIIILVWCLQMGGQFVAQLISNMERLDESSKEESEGIHNTMGKCPRSLLCIWIWRTKGGIAPWKWNLCKSMFTYQKWSVAIDTICNWHAPIQRVNTQFVLPVLPWMQRLHSLFPFKPFTLCTVWAFFYRGDIFEFHTLNACCFPGILENVFELRPEICVDACQQGLLTWILKRIKV